MNKAGNILTAILLAGAFLLSACGGDTPEEAKKPLPDVFFDGVLVERVGEQVTKMEAHITRPAQRLVPLGGENPGAIIVRQDLGVVWNLMPDKKVFLETPLRPEHKNPLLYEPDEILERETLGEEYVQGIKTMKERIVFRNKDDKEKTIIRWVALGLDFPLKAEDPDGKWEMHYEDVFYRDQSPDIFEIPKDYSVINARRSHWPGPDGS